MAFPLWGSVKAMSLREKKILTLFFSDGEGMTAIKLEGWGYGLNGTAIKKKTFLRLPKEFCKMHGQRARRKTCIN